MMTHLDDIHSWHVIVPEADREIDEYLFDLIALRAKLPGVHPATHSDPAPTVTLKPGERWESWLEGLIDGLMTSGEVVHAEMRTKAASMLNALEQGFTVRVQAPIPF